MSLAHPYGIRALSYSRPRVSLGQVLLRFRSPHYYDVCCVVTSGVDPKSKTVTVAVKNVQELHPFISAP